MDTLYLVVPCYNEEEVLPETSKRLREKMNSLISAGKISPESRVMLVNDGSKDRTWELIEALHGADKLFSGVCLSRNRGHQNALLAGLMTAKEKADMVISMDADLQDDIGAIDEMIDKYYDGCDIVYGVRSARDTDTAFKRGTAGSFYKLINRMGGQIVDNHADYRLMSRRALEALSDYGEVNLFLRGIVPMIGYKTDIVYYERGERFAGESKYPLKKMLAFAADGVTSLTLYPLRAIFFAGCALCALALALLVVFIISACFGNSLLSWRLVLVAVVLMGGLNLTALGVIGEYIGKIGFEVKHRPRYIISKVIDE